jgi:hypothetical protein
LETFLAILSLTALVVGRLYLEELADECAGDLPARPRDRALTAAFD